MSPLPVTGSTKFYALIGYPVEQVRTPTVLNAHLTERGIDSVMVMFNLLPENLEDFFKIMKRWQNCLGCCVTIPHKTQTLQLLDSFADRARRIGAVNIIRRDAEGYLHGNMMDGLGFLGALKKNNATAENKNIVIVGGGGASSAIADSVAEAGAKQLSILEINKNRQTNLISNLRKTYPSTSIYDQLVPGHSIDIVINASPLGMTVNDPLPFPLKKIKGSIIVADVVTIPDITEFLKNASRAGHVIQRERKVAEAQMSLFIDFMGIPKEANNSLYLGVKKMRCEFIAIGTELLLGQIVNSNAAWLGEQLALAGIDCLYQVTIGDNRQRMKDTITQALERSDAVIVSGGLGPTQDDITREVIAEVMSVDLIRDEEIAEKIRYRFETRGRVMSDNNLRQADIPEGGMPIPQMPGTAPGLICPLGDKVIYAVPGVPFEMKIMVNECILPDMKKRAGLTAIIKSRVLKTWGQTESGLDEMLTERMAYLDEVGGATIAFQASGIEGLKVRITVKAGSEQEAEKALSDEEKAVREIIGEFVFGTDEETMESVVLDMLRRRNLTLAIAESVTGGMVGARLTSVPGSSDVLKGCIVAYASEIKYNILDVPEGPVVTPDAARAMAEGARNALGADVGISTTGVAGPSEQEGQAVGTVHLGLAIGDQIEAQVTHLPGDRARIREYGVISLLNFLRLRLLGRNANTPFAGKTR